MPSTLTLQSARNKQPPGTKSNDRFGLKRESCGAAAACRGGDNRLAAALRLAPYSAGASTGAGWLVGATVSDGATVSAGAMAQQRESLPAERVSLLAKTLLTDTTTNAATAAKTNFFIVLILFTYEPIYLSFLLSWGCSPCRPAPAVRLSWRVRVPARPMWMPAQPMWMRVPARSMVPRCPKGLRCRLALWRNRGNHCLRNGSRCLRIRCLLILQPMRLLLQKLTSS